MLNKVGTLLFWFFLGMSLRAVQVDGLQSDIMDLLTIAVGLSYVGWILWEAGLKKTSFICNKVE